jgi:DNA-binding response OmpR family regulator
MKILLAEDDPSIAFITQTCLEKIGGHSVFIAVDGEIALSEALRSSYDLLVLDGMMPKKTGLQVATEYRKVLQALTPIIFLSARFEEKEVEKYHELGGGFIAKPFDPMTICQQIDEIFHKLMRAAA